ncbi:maltooligosyl trehalose hydrolase [Candidatus Koribacter versatilis Ellin345]|uniref:Malto-oligosyltrehalose trehalohydrolase n=1 Tax=Koribacter versatilis (strain Ellin345) TaxID=204669 RepID=Q1IV54_KORVE|nr:malto-oligosyltrehalose trehalohydrolase [Candidatus Koribacter versatilis]ABF39246.1 maltooligosyl trehalose hydrolase [Candidatus Koribacter versatilis Ellin345]
MKTSASQLQYGASLRDGRVHFRVWAPNAKSLSIRLIQGSSQNDQPMQRDDRGEWTLEADAHAGDRYFCVINGEQAVPDPVSRFQPEGVHGPTEIVDPSQFQWSDENWEGVDYDDYVIYELHVGTFTPEGTLDAAIEKLPYLKALGITVVELMPVNAFPGKHNWGYDGVGLYAVQESYGGPEALRRFVDAAHAHGLAVILDVVYNHLGNEGNYLRMFGPYFTDHHKTPWGEAINYDTTPGCEHVRRFVIDNALYWIREYHLDGLRLDAVQTIKDDSSKHVLQELQENVQTLAAELGRKVCVIAETDENISKYVRPFGSGYGLQGFWSDDFHHAIHAYFTGERQGYYQDFGDPEQIVTAIRDGYAFQGQPFKFWKGTKRGELPVNVQLPRNVICTQNHDQVGNRAKGERLTTLVPRGARYVSAALLLLAPHTPLLFMGQEYDEEHPFQFFTDYGDPVLQNAVSEGRRKEFEDFDFREVPDPQDPETFNRSRLDWSKAVDTNPMLRWYRELLRLRKRYVTSGERTAYATYQDGVITMMAPGDTPDLILFATLEPGRQLPAEEDGWNLTLKYKSEDGYQVRIFTR